MFSIFFSIFTQIKPNAVLAARLVIQLKLMFSVATNCLTKTTRLRQNAPLNVITSFTVSHFNTIPISNVAISNMQILVLLDELQTVCTHVDAVQPNSTVQSWSLK